MVTLGLRRCFCWSLIVSLSTFPRAAHILTVLAAVLGLAFVALVALVGEPGPPRVNLGWGLLATVGAGTALPRSER